MRAILIALLLACTCVPSHAAPQIAIGSCDTLGGPPQISCAALEAAFADSGRRADFAAISKGWARHRRAMFARLLVAEAAFARAVRAYETAPTTGDSATDVDKAEDPERDAFLEIVRQVVAGRTKRSSLIAFDEADSALNATYQRVMTVRDRADLAWGIEKAGIKRSERAWLAYRDAFVAFAASFEDGAAKTVKTELTRRRTVSLEGLLAD